MHRALSRHTRKTAMAAAAACAFGFGWACAHAGCGSGASDAEAPDSGTATDAAGADVLGDPSVPDADASRDRDATDSATTLDAGADAPWFASPEGWTRVTDELAWFEPCELWIGDLTKLAVPTLQWTSCGDGCEVADTTGGSIGYVRDIAGETFGGRPMAQIAFGIPDPTTPISVGRLIDLDSGAVLAAFMFKLHSTDGMLDCSCGAVSGLPRAFTFLRSGEAGPDGMGGAIYWDPASQGWLNIDPPQLIGYGPVQGILDSLPAAAARSLGGSVYVSGKLRPLSYTKVFSGYSGAISTLADQVIFPDWTTLGPGVHAKLVSWTPSTGLQTLVAADHDPLVTALSDSHIVWVGAPAKLDEVASPTNVARFYWSPPARTPAEAQVHEGPQIPQSPPLIEDPIQTHGDYAAGLSWTVVGGQTLQQLHDEWRIAVTQLSTGKLWMLKARSADRTPVRPLAIAESYLYVTEGLPGSNNVTVIVRYAIDKLDALAAQ